MQEALNSGGVVEAKQEELESIPQADLGMQTSSRVSALLRGTERAILNSNRVHPILSQSCAAG